MTDEMDIIMASWCQNNTLGMVWKRKDWNEEYNMFKSSIKIISIDLATSSSVGSSFFYFSEPFFHKNGRNRPRIQIQKFKISQF